MKKLAWEENYCGKIPAEELIKIVDGQSCHEIPGSAPLCQHPDFRLQGEAVHCSTCGVRLDVSGSQEGGK